MNAASECFFFQTWNEFVSMMMEFRSLELCIVESIGIFRSYWMMHQITSFNSRAKWINFKRMYFIQFFSTHRWNQDGRSQVQTKALSWQFLWEQILSSLLHMMASLGCHPPIEHKMFLQQENIQLFHLITRNSISSLYTIQ